jgi:serine/threonine protein kinase
MTQDAHHNALQPDYDLLWYRIKRVLGQGAFGITYLAHDINLDRLVAIKEYMPGHLAVRVPDLTVRPLSSEHQEDFNFGLSRFISEARTLTKFEHPNLVRVFNAFEGNNTAYMVMNYEVGDNLQTVVKREKTLTEDELLKIMLPLMDGLQKMHAQNFIHRDIKPGNIFIRKAEGSPVLLDFGSARQTRMAGAQTLTNFVSPGYAPIEQYTSNSDKQGPWTDIYGLGATIYKIITGTAPVNAVDRGEAIMHDGKDCHVPLVQQALGGYSPSFLAAIDHALAFNAANRPQSINDWRMELPASCDQISAEAVTNAAVDSAVISLDKETTKINGGASEETRPVKTEQTFRLAKNQQEEQAVPAQPDSLSRDVKYKTRLYAAAVVIMVVAIAVVWGVLFRGDMAGTKMITSEPGTNTGTTGETRVPASAMDEGKAQVTGQTDAHAEQIQQLLAQAENSVRELRLTSPPGNNAYEQYRQVLTLDPENEQATNGVHTISDKYVALAYGAIKTDNTGKAGLYINKAREIWPDSEKIQPAQKALQARLDEIAKQKQNTAAEQNTRSAVAGQPAQEQQPAKEKTEESGGLVGGVKKWFKENAEKNKNSGNKDGTGDQFVKSIGGSK